MQSYRFGDGVPDMPSAICASTDRELFFTEKGVPPKEAKAQCNTPCPERETCLAWALAQGYDLYGVWGGTSQRERQKMLKELQDESGGSD